MNSPEILEQLEDLHSDFSLENIKIVRKLVDNYITDYSKDNSNNYLSTAKIGLILENTKHLKKLPLKFDIETEEFFFRKQYAKHVSQICMHIRVAYKAYVKEQNGSVSIQSDQ
jgi:hypothetical protein